MVLRGVSKANLYLGVLQGTKIADGFYTRRSAGCSVVARDVPSWHRGGVVVFYRASPRFAIEAIQQFGPNIFIFQLDTGYRRW